LIGALYFVAWGLGLGAGNVVAPSYEYGNTFLIVAGLLNVSSRSMRTTSPWAQVAVAQNACTATCCFSLCSQPDLAGVRRAAAGHAARAGRLWLLLFAGFLGAALVLGWVMYRSRRPA